MNSVEHIFCKYGSNKYWCKQKYIFVCESCSNNHQKIELFIIFIRQNMWLAILSAWIMYVPK
jgi:hypothetical protein